MRRGTPGTLSRRGRVQRYLDTVRYLAPGQIANRAWRTARRRSGLHGAHGRPALSIRANAPDLYAGMAFAAAEPTLAEQFAAAVEAGEAVCAGHFTFLGRIASLDIDRLPWGDSSHSQLWRYHLHYFGYVQDLIALAHTDGARRARAQEAFVRLAGGWIAANPPARGDGWHPYTVSLRLINWLHAVRHLVDGRDVPDRFAALLRASMTAQARYLARNLEHDVRGNHLIENLRALIACGLSFEGREPIHWRERGLAALEREVAEQILSDGGHFERAPGYHAVVQGDLLEIALWLRRGQLDVPGWLTAAIRRMSDYLIGILPTTGRLPLVKDTAWDLAPDPGDILIRSALLLHEPRWKRSKQFPLGAAIVFGASGLQTFRSWPLARSPIPSALYPAVAQCILRDDRRGDHLFFDVGKPCPEYLPAHAHADLLSYELIASGERIVVDSGVYEYTAGPWRDFFRSTRAHATVEVAGVDQSEVWGSFRVARRARPGPVHWHAGDTSLLVQGSHDGYRRLRPAVIHRRAIVWQRDAFWLFADELLGHGEIDAVSHVHLHPDVLLEEMAVDMWRLGGRVETLWLTGYGMGEPVVCRGQIEPMMQGWYAERFGEVLPNTTLALPWRGRLPGFWGYVIAREAPATVALAATAQGYSIVVRHLNRDFHLDLPRTGRPTYR